MPPPFVVRAASLGMRGRRVTLAGPAQWRGSPWHICEATVGLAWRQSVRPGRRSPPRRVPGHPERDDEVGDPQRVVEGVAEQLAQLAHAVAHGLRVDEQRLGRPARGGRRCSSHSRSVSSSRSRLAGVESSSGASACARRSARAIGSAPSTISARWASVSYAVCSAPARVARPRRARWWEVAASRHGRVGPRTTSCPSRARTQPASGGRASGRGTIRAAHVVAGVDAGHVLGEDQRPPVHQGRGCGAARSPGRAAPSRSSGRSQPARSARRVTSSSDAPRTMSRASRSSWRSWTALGGGELVGVTGDAGRGQLVDVGEDQLGEPRQQLGATCPPGRSPRTARATRRGRRCGRPTAGRPCCARCGPRPGRGRRTPRGPGRGACWGRPSGPRWTGSVPSATCTAVSMLPTR